MCWDAEERHHPQEAEQLACPQMAAKQVVVTSPALGHEGVTVGSGLRKSSTGQTLEQDPDIPNRELAAPSKQVGSGEPEVLRERSWAPGHPEREV